MIHLSFPHCYARRGGNTILVSVVSWAGVVKGNYGQLQHYLKSAMMCHDRQRRQSDHTCPQKETRYVKIPRGHYSITLQEVIGKLNYLLPLYGGTHDKYLQKIQVVLNNTVKFITGAGKRAKTMSLTKSIN